jgi:hypothetical protein
MNNPICTEDSTCSNNIRSRIASLLISLFGDTVIEQWWSNKNTSDFLDHALGCHMSVETPSYLPLPWLAVHLGKALSKRMNKWSGCSIQLGIVSSYKALVWSIKSIGEVYICVERGGVSIS